MPVYEYSLEHFRKALCMKHQELEKQKFFCQYCKQPINLAVYDYSTGRYNKPLCINCQTKLNKITQKGDNTFEDKGFYCKTPSDDPRGESH